MYDVLYNYTDSFGVTIEITVLSLCMCNVFGLRQICTANVFCIHWTSTLCLRSRLLRSFASLDLPHFSFIYSLQDLFERYQQTL